MGLIIFYGMFMLFPVVLNVGYYGMLSVLENIVIDLNNVMCFDYFLHRVMKT